MSPCSHVRGTFVTLVLSQLALLLVPSPVSHPLASSALRFTLDRKECLTHHVSFVGDMVHGSFVVINAQSWGDWEPAGVDLVVHDPDDHPVHESHGQTEGTFEFMSMSEGDYRFCFTNKSPVFEQVSFDAVIGHTVKEDELAKDEHVTKTAHRARNLYTRMITLNYEAKFHHEQARRQMKLAKATTGRLIVKTLLQSAALIVCSSLQVYLLHRLFEKKLGRTLV